MRTGTQQDLESTGNINAKLDEMYQNMGQNADAAREIYNNIGKTRETAGQTVNYRKLSFDDLTEEEQNMIVQQKIEKEKRKVDGKLNRAKTGNILTNIWYSAVLPFLAILLEVSQYVLLTVGFILIGSKIIPFVFHEGGYYKQRDNDMAMRMFTYREKAKQRAKYTVQKLPTTIKAFYFPVSIFLQIAWVLFVVVYPLDIVSISYMMTKLYTVIAVFIVMHGINFVTRLGNVLWRAHDKWNNGGQQQAREQFERTKAELEQMKTDKDNITADDMTTLEKEKFQVRNNIYAVKDGERQVNQNE